MFTEKKRAEQPEFWIAADQVVSPAQNGFYTKLEETLESFGFGMNAQLRGHFRGRFATAQPQLHSVLLEYLIELLSGLFGLGHRFNHTRLFVLRLC